MRKSHLFSAVLSLFLLLPASITRAQMISTEKGLTTAKFSTRYGNVKVYLPSDIRAGDVISGTVSCEADEKHKDMIEIIKYSIAINGKKVPVSAISPFTIQIPVESQKSIIIELKDNKGKSAGQLNCPVQLNDNNTRPGGCAIPSHVLQGSPFSIPGNFDGNAANTKCLLGRKSVEILAESPRQLFCTPVSIDMADPGSNRAMVVQENGKQNCSGDISLVNIDVSSGKLKLKKGETTYIHVKITGLQSLPDTAVLTVNNLTPNVITITNGNEQIIPILPSDTANGIFSLRCPVVGIGSGISQDFAVSINLDLPEPPVVFADVRKPHGGKRDEGVLTAGTRTALEIGMKKWADANTEGKNPVDYDCPNCFQCIKSRTTESNVSQVGGLGWGIITSFLSGAAKFAGGILEKVKDIADKGGDIYKALKEMIDAGQIQVVGIKEDWCPNNEYCKVTGIIVYDVLNGCVEAVYKCVGTKMCCPFGETTYTLKYCLDKDGAVIDETVSISISH